MRGLQSNERNLEAVRNSPQPVNLKQFRQFLGLTSYYRRFIPGYARLAHPLHALTRKAEANITVVGHQTKTGHKCHVTKHTVTQSVKMAGQKRPSERTLQQTLSSGSSTAGAKKNKRQVSLSTFKKWQQKYDSQSLSISVMVKMRGRQNGQDPCRTPVLFSL